MTILRSFRSLPAKLKVIGFLLFALRHRQSNSNSNNECDQSAQEDKQTNCDRLLSGDLRRLLQATTTAGAINRSLNIAYFGYR